MKLNVTLAESLPCLVALTEAIDNCASGNSGELPTGFRLMGVAGAVAVALVVSEVVSLLEPDCPQEANKSAEDKPIVRNLIVCVIRKNFNQSYEQIE